jgi:hypothetical protein
MNPYGGNRVRIKRGYGSKNVFVLLFDLLKLKLTKLTCRRMKNVSWTISAFYPLG